MHVVNPLSNPSSAGAVHGWLEGAPFTICSHMPAYAEYKGRRMLRVIETDEPLHCQGCQKALEVIARAQLKNLSPAGLEKVMDLIAAMRNGDIRE